MSGLPQQARWSLQWEASAATCGLWSCLADSYCRRMAALPSEGTCKYSWGCSETNLGVLPHRTPLSPWFSISLSRSVYLCC